MTGKAPSLKQAVAAAFAALSAAACATTINVPEDAVVISQYASSMMQSESPVDQAMGQLAFLEYAASVGDEDFTAYFESSPELAIVWADYNSLDSDQQEEVDNILSQVDYDRPATRITALQELSEILPSFELSGEMNNTENASHSSQPQSQTVTAENQNGIWTFRLDH